MAANFPKLSILDKLKQYVYFKHFNLGPEGVSELYMLVPTTPEAIQSNVSGFFPRPGCMFIAGEPL